MPEYRDGYIAMTIYNVLPPGFLHPNAIPMHSTTADPFKNAFTFGSMIPKGPSKHMHIALDSSQGVAGFLTGPGDTFMVSSDNHFVILSPKSAAQSIGTALFPSGETHTAQIGTSGCIYPIHPGSCIVAHNQLHSSSDPGFKSMTIFLWGNEYKAQSFYYNMVRSICYFRSIWEAITSEAVNKKTGISLNLERFSNPKSPLIALSQKYKAAYPAMMTASIGQPPSSDGARMGQQTQKPEEAQARPDKRQLETSDEVPGNPSKSTKV